MTIKQVFYPIIRVMRRRRSSPVALLAGAGLLAGCTVSALDPNDLRTETIQPSSATSQDDPLALVPEGQDTTTAEINPAETAARQQAIDEIRAKANQTPGEKPVIGPTPQSNNKHMTAREKAALAAEMRRSVQAADSEISDAELAAKRRAMGKLRKKADSHYEKTLRSIEN